MELGGGVGLTSLAGALYANTVICTGKMWVGLSVYTVILVDTGDKVLQLCSKNIQYNTECLSSDVVQGEVGVPQYD